MEFITDGCDVISPSILTAHISVENAFSRYENGKTNPPLALIKLLKVLDRHPDLLDEVKAA